MTKQLVVELNQRTIGTLQAALENWVEDLKNVLHDKDCEDREDVEAELDEAERLYNQVKRM